MKRYGRKSRLCSFILTAAIIFGNGTLTYAEENAILPEELEYVPGEILVVYKEDISDAEIEQVAEEMDGEVVETITETEDSKVALVSISDDTTVQTAVEEYTEADEVAYAEPNYVIDSFEDIVDVESDPLMEKQWYLDYVHAPAAWDILNDYRGEKVRIGVIDTGVRLDHEDLQGVINADLSVEIVRDTGTGTCSTQPLRGDGFLNGTEEQNSNTVHGTHVAGIIAAEGGNGVGIQGVASVGNSSGQNTVADIVAIDAFTVKNTKGEDASTVADVVYAMKYAKDHGCRIVNLSLGTANDSEILKSTCADLKENGITIVCAAGNSGTSAPIYPADYDSTIGVINIDSTGNKNSSSSYGNAKDLSAPGTKIFSTYSNGISAYGYLSGSSMASPVVSAAAAMLLYVDPSLKPDQIKEVLCDTATDLMEAGKDIYTGYGAVNIENALKKVTGQPISGEIQDETKVLYRAHAQTYGWLDWTENGNISGTTGESKRLEAVQINLEHQGYTGNIEYRTHVQTYGWSDWTSNGEVSGTTGEAKRMEAIQIRLTGELAEHYDIYYRVHAQTYGWMGWAANGAVAGTSGYAKRMEAIEIQLVKKGELSPGSMENAYRHPLVQYQTHVQTYGWQAKTYDGISNGTTGQAKRLEGIRIELPAQDYSGDILYRTHIQTYGWQDFVSNGELSGTTGKSKRLEAIEIKLTGEMEQHYDIYYRVHIQTYGWLDWAKNGEPAGSEGLAKRLEAIEIVLVEKGSPAPGATDRRFYK